MPNRPATNLDHPFSELVLGVSFVAPSFSVFDYGILADRLKSKYPSRTMQPPIAAQAEFGPQVFMPQLPRVWLESEDGHRLVQLQQDRLLFNWKRVDKHGAYPHFAPLFSEFEEAWNMYRVIVSELGEVSIEPQRFECSYINNLTGAFREAVGGPLFKFESRGWNEYLPLPSLRLVQYTFDFDNLRLRVTTRPAIELALQREVLSLQLDAVSNSAKVDMEAWFQDAHDVIGRAFEDILTPEALAIWRVAESD